MKAEELMIGDWVLCDMYNPCDPYYPPGTMGEFQMRPEDYTNGLAEKYKPVPLTSEILERNGVKHVYGYSIEDFKLYGNLGKKDEVYFTIIVSNKEIRIDYVHELQHALRLCGINKEIKL